MGGAPTIRVRTLDDCCVTMHQGSLSHLSGQCRRLNATYTHITTARPESSARFHGNGRDTQIRPDQAQVPDRELDTIPHPLKAR